MASVTGSVRYIKFVADIGKVRILDEVSGMEETLLLWSGPVNAGGPTAMFVMQLTLALAQRLRVTISTGAGDASAFIASVKVLAPSP